MTKRRNYECERDRWVGLWKKDPTNDCISQKDMNHNAAVQTLSTHMMETYGVCLRLVSSQAIRPYLDLDDKTPETLAFKRKVFAMILEAIKTDTNPFTGMVWGNDIEYGLTRPVVCDIIRFIRTGKRPNDKQQIKLRRLATKKDLELFNWMRDRSLDACESNEDKAAILALCSRTKGM